MLGKMRKLKPDLLDSIGCDMASKCGLDVVKCEVKVLRAELAEARFPTNKYGRTERDA